MKISIENYRFREALGDEGAIKAISDAGFEALDFSYYWTKNARNLLGGDWKERAREIKAMLDAAGIVCNQAHAPFELVWDDRLDESEEKYIRLTRSIGSAAMLGARDIVVHCIKTPELSDLCEYNHDFYSRLRKYGEEYGIRIAVENLFTVDRDVTRGLLGTPEELCGIVRGLGSGFICCVDLGHASITGTKPQDFIARMDSELLGALHVQDNDLKSDCHWLPYQGRHDWSAIMSALKEKGYTGDITLEVFGWLGHQPVGLLPESARHAAAVANYLRGLL